MDGYFCLSGSFDSDAAARCHVFVLVDSILGRRVGVRKTFVAIDRGE